MSPEEKTENTLGGFKTWTMGADLKEGTRIGRYQILGLIGKGGMGAVYQAYDPELDRSIAIKMLTVKPDEGETASRPQARLMREAQALAKLSHPNVVAVHDVGSFEEDVYIAMEYVKGKTLREWIKEEEPTHKEIINVLSKAANGLQAAHCEGIVHRDFKPENVVIGDKGQVKVLDFGLARAARNEDAAILHEALETTEKPTSGEQLLSAPLTQIGARIGTAVYMAPEHFQRKELDEKTDQFSFCVTLFEALYGKRPFHGRTLKELEKNIAARWIEIPKGADVPKWIKEIILKGLSESKNNRFQDMTSLVEALGSDPEIAKKTKRTKLVITSVIVLLTFMTLGIGYYAFFKGSKVCTGAVIKTAGVWNENKKAKIKQAFAKTDLPYAVDSFVRVEKRLGDYLEKWAAEYTETCEATRLRGEQSEEILDLKISCLNKHLMNAVALTRVFADADNTVVQKSVQAVSSLSGFSNCSDAEKLRSRIPPPKDKKTKIKVVVIREKISEMEALEKTGKYRKGLVLAKKIEKLADAAGYKPVQAELSYWQGVLYERAGQYKQAETNLYDAVSAAGESKDSFLLARVLVSLVRVVGYQQARYDEGLSLSRTAEAVLRIGGDDEELRSLILANQGILFWRKEVHDKALEYFRRALTIREKLLGQDHFSVAKLFGNMGVVLEVLGDNDRALRYYRKSLAIQKKMLGPQHPHVAITLNNIGILYYNMSEYDKSFDYFSKARLIFEKALGLEHPHVAFSLNNMGLVFKINGKYEKAIECFNKALSIREKSLGTNHPLVAVSLTSIGDMLVNQRRHQEALEPLERAVTLCKNITCDHYEYGHGLFALARALEAAKGHKKRSVRLAKQARELFGKDPKRLKKELKEVDIWLKKYDKGLSLAKQ